MTTQAATVLSFSEFLETQPLKSTKWGMFVKDQQASGRALPDFASWEALRMFLDSPGRRDIRVEDARASWTAYQSTLELIPETAALGTFLLSAAAEVPTDAVLVEVFQSDGLILASVERSLQIVDGSISKALKSLPMGVNDALNEAALIVNASSGQGLRSIAVRLKDAVVWDPSWGDIQSANAHGGNSSVTDSIPEHVIAIATRLAISIPSRSTPIGVQGIAQAIWSEVLRDRADRSTLH